MAAEAEADRLRVCAKCGVSYPAQYVACPRCTERDNPAWRIARIAIVVLVVLYALARLSGVSAALL
jgi:hypothetical protein